MHNTKVTAQRQDMEAMKAMEQRSDMPQYEGDGEGAGHAGDDGGGRVMSARRRRRI